MVKRITLNCFAVLAGVLILAAPGCAGPSIAFLGNWTGDFIITKNDSHFPTKQFQFRSFLQIYNYDQKFTMHVSDHLQTVVIDGKWELHRKQIILHVDSADVEQPSQNLMDASGRAWLPGQTLTSGFQQNQVFNIDKTHTHLQGLLIDIGPLRGYFSLDKNGPGRGL